MLIISTLARIEIHTYLLSAFLLCVAVFLFGVSLCIGCV